MVPRTIQLVRLLGAAACVAGLAGGCGGSAPLPAPGPEALPDPCLLPAGERGSDREIVVVAGRPEDSVFVAPRQPESLIRLNCTGTARPAAAKSWTPDSSHRTWTFVLAWSTVPVSAPSVAAEWTARPEAATTLRQAGVESVIPLDEERLVVTLSSPSDSVPAVFADPTLSVVTDSVPRTGTTFVLRHPESADLRDALDDGADILRTEDPALAEYARQRGEFEVHPLPWSRTYLLIIPVGRARLDGLIQRGDSAGFRAALARDAVHAEARGAERPYWWEGLGQCPGSDSLPRLRARVLVDSNAVVFPAEDPVARALAERVVALSDSPRISTGSVPQRSLGEALTASSARAYVVAVPRIPLLPCRAIATWPASPMVVPLIDIRESAIARRGIPQLTVEFDGRLRPVEAP